MRNHLHEIVDAANKGKFGVFVSENSNKVAVQEGRRLGAEFVRKHAPNAVCFSADFEDVGELAFIWELVRLPYPTCWFEFSTSTRCGFLMLQDGNRLCYAQFVGSPWRLFGILEWDLATDGLRRVWFDEDEGFRRYSLMSLGLVVKYLSALNCVNITRKEHRSDPDKQKVRKAMGRCPLYSTWTLEIDLVRSREERIDQGGTHASPRLHLRRGHARQHRPGVWCWVNAHVVGNKARGMVEKDYGVAA